MYPLNVVKHVYMFSVVCSDGKYGITVGTLKQLFLPASFLITECLTTRLMIADYILTMFMYLSKLCHASAYVHSCSHSSLTMYKKEL